METPSNRRASGFRVLGSGCRVCKKLRSDLYAAPCIRTHRRRSRVYIYTHTDEYSKVFWARVYIYRYIYTRIYIYICFCMKSLGF